MRITTTLGDIVETVFLDFGDIEVEKYDQIYERLTGFSVGLVGRIRLGTAIIEMHDPDNLNFVPLERYDINPCPWNSHQMYVEIELPNIARDEKQYHLVRNAFMKELNRRIKKYYK